MTFEDLPLPLLDRLKWGSTAGSAAAGKWRSQVSMDVKLPEYPDDGS